MSFIQSLFILIIVEIVVIAPPLLQHRYLPPSVIHSLMVPSLLFFIAFYAEHLAGGISPYLKFSH